MYGPLERLEQGNIEFLFDPFISLQLLENIIREIRESSNRHSIINGFLEKLKNKDPEFCLQVIYDMEEYKEVVFEILTKKKELYSWFKTPEILNILNKTSWGYTFLLNHLEELLEKNDDLISPLLKYLFQEPEKGKEILKSLYLHKNLKIRAKFMIELVKNHFDKINTIYDDITKYLTSSINQEFELMPSDEISKLAIQFLKHNDKKTYLKLKEFILKNYKENDLSFLLLNNEYNPNFKEEFAQDSDRLFSTSHTYQFEIYENYTKALSREMLENFQKFISYFKEEEENEYFYLKRLFHYGLGKILQENLDKYLSISRNKDWGFVRYGSTCSCYRIGDYVFKLIRYKYSNEKILCPNLYIILKNLEEVFVRDRWEEVVAGLEIQKYLTRKISEYPREIQNEIIQFLKTELERLGYYNKDTLIKGPYGDNCMLLDSYLDADAPNVELLPPFFKQYPAVYIDRDMFFKLENSYPRYRKMHY